MDHAPPPPKRPSSRFAPALLGLVAGIAATYAFMRAPTTTDGIDFNGDGVVDERWTLSLGNVERSEVDTDGDTLPNLRPRFRSGILDSTEYINPNTGFPFRVEHYSIRGLASAEIDTNNDGKLDQRLIYSPTLEIVRTEPIGLPR